MTREEIIDLIDNRIKSEYKKHGDLDWSRIAAHKIYGSLEGALDVGKEREDSVMMRKTKTNPTLDAIRSRMAEDRKKHPIRWFLVDIRFWIAITINRIRILMRNIFN